MLSSSSFCWKVPEPVLRGFLGRYLAKRLVGMLSDPIEKCREMAGGVCVSFSQVVRHGEGGGGGGARRVLCFFSGRSQIML